MKVAVFALSLLSIGAVAQVPSGPPQNAAAAQGPIGFGRQAIKSPEVSLDGSVTVRLRAPDAQKVAVTGLGQRVEMQKDDTGVWSATIASLKPDIYMYQFSVDGGTINDPSNPHLATSFGNGGRSVLTVPGTAPWTAVNGVPHGAVTEVRFHSDVVGDDRDFFVYTPPNYDPKRKEPYPVLYLLHGLGDDAQSWLTQGGSNFTLDNLIAQGKAVPMIVVNPLGYGTANGGQGPIDMLNIFAKTLLNEVMPRVEASFNASKKREDHAITGLSMGGAEATLIGLNNLDKFAYIGSFSGAYVMWPGANAPRGATPPSAAPAGTMGADGNRPTATPPAIAPGPATQAETGARPAPTAAGRAPQQPGIGQNIIDTNFTNLNAKANSQIKLLYIVCGTADGLIGVNRQFKSWLKERNVQFTEVEVPDMAHVWPLWRQNLTDFAPLLFTKK
jgi:enterochelin esterase-like enzyme